MLQIIGNYLAIYVIPILIGTAVRCLCRRLRRAYLVTAALAALAVITWIAASVIPAHGSELYGLRALQATSMALGALAAGLLLRLGAKR